MPFTPARFFDVFQSYNESVWPAQLLLISTAVGAIAFARWRARLLCALWAWCAIAYFWSEFTAISAAGWIFGSLFLAGAFFLLDDAGPAEDVGRARRAAGAFFVAYALVLYPLIGYLAGQRYPSIPTFGAPCPLVIFTMGMLIATRRRAIVPAIAPLLWSVIGTSGAILFGVPEDFAMPLAAVVLIVFDIQEVVRERHRTRHA